MKMLRQAVSAVVATVCAASVAHAAPLNLMTNGSFETGDFSGWTPVGDQTFSGVTCAPGFGADGTCAAFFGSLGSTSGIAQTIGNLQVGTDYLVRFALSAIGDAPSSATVSFGGSTVLSLTNPTTATPYANYAFDLKATSSSASLAFSFRDDIGFIKLDAVSVSVPEPVSFAVFGMGLAALGVARRTGRTVRAKLPT